MKPLYRRIGISHWVWITMIASASTASAAEKSRVWVDVEGKFSVQAVLVDVEEDEVRLRRSNDGKTITIARNRLSDIDREYVSEAAQRVEDDNPLRLEPPDAPEYVPLAPLTIADDGTQTPLADDGSALPWPDATASEVENQLPPSMPGDPCPVRHAIPESHLRIFRIDSFQKVSDPIALSMVDENGIRSTSLAVSVSALGSLFSGGPAGGPPASTSKIVRFAPNDSKAFIAFESPEPMRMLDHHQSSQRTLVVMGRANRRRIGELVVMEGWQKRNLKITRRMKLNIEGNLGLPANLRHGFLIDKNHALLSIDRSIALWNLQTGQCVYRIDGADPRSAIAVSGGRRYLAIPFAGGVDLRRADTGEPIGKIPVEDQTPSVSFSDDGTRLAIVTSKRLRIWDLKAAALSADVSTRRSFGRQKPVWVDSDLVLTGSGLLVSLFRALPVWRYDLGTDRIKAVGHHLAVFRKHPVGEMSVLKLPHAEAAAQIERIDRGEVDVDRDTWRIAKQSRWSAGDWVE